MGNFSIYKYMPYISSSVLYFLTCVFLWDSAESYELVQFLNLFENCMVEIYDYKDVTIPLDFPVVIHSNKTFKLETTHHFHTRSTTGCLALFYILPKTEVKENDDFNSDWLYGQRKPRSTQPRYDILIDWNKNAQNDWLFEYEMLVADGTSSHGLILSLEENPSYYPIYTISSKLLIVNQLQLSKGKFVTLSRDLKSILKWGSKGVLDSEIADVNDKRNNLDVTWTLKKELDLSNVPIGNQELLDQMLKGIGVDGSERLAEKIQGLIKDGSLTLGSSQHFLKPRRVSEEGLENYLFAFLAIGTNVTLANNSESLMGLSILFNVEKGQIMKQKDNGFGFLSCFPNSQKRAGIWQVAKELTLVFQPEVYLAMAITYVAPCFLLGCLYHFLLKSRIQKKYWIKWHPFTWGVRSLIWQAGDRILNSQRFGWTIWLVTPLMLVAVVISHTFRRSNSIFMLGQPLSMEIVLNNLEDLNWFGARMVTDDGRLAATEWGMLFGLDNYHDIGKALRDNTSIALVTSVDRATAVADLMRTGGNFMEMGCPGFRPVTHGGIWYAPSFLTDWKQRQPFWGRREYGWDVRSWGDDEVFWRLGILEGQSGIVKMWREMLQSRPHESNWYGTIVRRISMSCKIRYLFLVGLMALGTTLVVCILEWMWFKIWTEPTRKRIEKRQKKMGDAKQATLREEMATNSQAGNVGVPIGKLDDELVADALALAEETKGRNVSASSVKVSGSEVEIGRISEEEQLAKKRNLSIDQASNEMVMDIEVEAEMASLNDNQTKEGLEDIKEPDLFSKEQQPDHQSITVPDLNELDVGSVLELSEHEETDIIVRDNPSPSLSASITEVIDEQKEEVETDQERHVENGENAISQDSLKIDNQDSMQNDIQDSTQNDIQDSLQNDIQDSMQNDILDSLETNIQVSESYNPTT